MFKAATTFRAAIAAGLGSAMMVLPAAPQALAWPAETTRELAVREGPGQEYPHIEVIAPGTVVDIRHCNVERTWCKVDANGTVGYLRGAYLERIGDVYYGPRVDLYPSYRSRVWVAPNRPYPRYYDGPYHHHRRW